MLNMMLEARRQAALRRQREQAMHSASASSSSAFFAAPSPFPRQPEPPFVTSLTENDVLLGRGTPCAENEGNVRFRGLVRKRKAEYTAAQKRSRKDAIARDILNTIIIRGGKFLRKVESRAERDQLGVPPGIQDVWAAVDEDASIQKIKQALRNKDDTYETGRDEPEMSDAAHFAETNRVGATNQFSSGVRDDERESRMLRAGDNFQLASTAIDRFSGGESMHYDADSKFGSAPYGNNPMMMPQGKLPAYGSHLPKMKDPPGQDAPGVMKSRYENTGNPPEPGPRRQDLHETIDPRNPSAFDIDPRARHGPRHTLGVPPSPWLPGGGGHPGGDQLSRLMMLRRRQQQLLEQSQMMPPTTERGPRSLSELERARMHQQQQQQQQLHQMSMTSLEGPPGLGGMPNPYAQRASGFESTSAYAQGYQNALRDADMMGSPEYHPSPVQQQRQRLSLEGAPMGSSTASLRSLPQSPGPFPKPAPFTPTMPEAARRGFQLTAEASQPQGTSGGGFARQSTGERAVGLAVAMKRAEAFSATEALDISLFETLIISVLCCRGLPVWTPNTASLPDAKQSGGWNWDAFAQALKKEALRWEARPKEGTAGEPKVLRHSIQAASEYKKNVNELAKTTVMLLEKLRRHSAGVAGAHKHNAVDGPTSSVALWLEKELSRWAMTFDIAVPSSGRPIPFSSADFVSEHPQHRSNENVIAVSAFDPQLADDVIDQVALLSRLRSIFSKNKPLDLRRKIERVVRKIDSAGGPAGDDDLNFHQEMLLCDRLLSDGFANVLSSTKELDPAFEFDEPNIRPSPTFEKLNLNKFAIQHRVSSILHELHPMENSVHTQRLWDERMERTARSVGSSADTIIGKRTRISPPAEVETRKKQSKRKSMFDTTTTSSAKDKPGEEASKSESPVGAAAEADTTANPSAGKKRALDHEEDDPTQEGQNKKVKES